MKHGREPAARAGNGRIKIDMLHGSLADKIFIFALPLALSMILQQLFNSADVAVVGRFDSSQALAAVGSNGPAINILVNLFVGVSLGANVLVATCIGRNEPDRINRAVHTSISLALICGVLLLAFGWIMSPRILLFMDTPHDVIDKATLYLKIYFLGMPFTMLYNFGSAVLRSKGDSRRPLYAMIIAGVINVILNVILVVPLRMSVAGVAIATVTANAVSALIIMRCLMNEEEAFRLSWRKLALSGRDVAQVLRIGLPSGVQGMLFPISNIFVQAAINSFGSAASAGSAIALNFEFIAYFVVGSFTQAAVTFTSQNYGARNEERCRRVFAVCLAMSLAMTALTCGLFVLMRHELVSIYTLDAAVIPFALTRILNPVASIWITTGYEITGAAMRGMSWSVLPTAIMLTGCFAFRIIWIFMIFPHWNSFSALMKIYPFSWSITAVATLIAYFIIRKRAFAAIRGDSDTQE